MRLDPVLDSLYLLSSLWGGGTGPSVCPSASPAPPRATLETPWTPPPAAAAAAAVTAFVAVNVIPLDRERVLEQQTVLIEGGRITALGPVAQVPVPAGAVRIDGRGKYLLPGLADMHAHLPMYFQHGVEHSERRMFRYLANGVTTVRNTGTDGSGEKEQLLKHLKSAKVLGPRLYISPCCGAQLLPELQAMRPDSLAPYIAAQVPGYDFIAITRVRDPGERVIFDSILAVARRLRLPVASHDHKTSFEGLLALGSAGGSLEHMYAFDSTPWGSWQTMSPAGLQATAAAVQRAGAWITMTLVCQGKHFNLKDGGALVRALQDAGAGLLLGIDLDGGGPPNGRNSPYLVHAELARAVQAQLTPYEALLTGTRNVAQYFSILDSSGTVAVGKRADLVLLPGNPLQDIRHTREPAGVMIAGRWLDRVALDQGLLAAPKAWFDEELLSGQIHTQFMGKFAALLDSLAAATPAAREGVRRRLAAELGAVRAALTPGQQEAFDVRVRVWLREQARQGYPVTIPGVAPVP
jgi:imidazolonepropionase-like amidohydrolase